MSAVKYTRSIFLLLTGFFILHAQAQQSDLNLQDTTIATEATFTANNSITAGPNLSIAETGDLTLITNGNIYFKSGLTVESGGQLQTIAGIAVPAIITIDGQRDSLYATLALPSEGHIQIPIEAIDPTDTDIPSGPDDLFARVWMAWDENYLYYYEERKDDILLVNNTTSWQNDCVELKIDSDPTAPLAADLVENIRFTVFGADSATEAIGVDNLNGEANLKYANGDIWTPTTADYARFYPEDGSGVHMEFRVPWEVINTNGPITPAIGTEIGLAINIADNDEVLRTSHLFWAAVINDNVWNTPANHGTLKLLDDNRVSFIAENRREPANVNVNADAWYTDLFTGIEIDRKAEIVYTYMLRQNYPNPFNPTTKIAYSLKGPESVSLFIYDVNGRLVNKLISNQYQPAGSYEVTWDGTTASGSKVVSGVYFYKLVTSSFVANKKMLLLK